jgi:DNA-directed RNA polymerase subunit beta'
VTGKSIKVHPLVVGGFNADFDGDTMAMYVPVTEEAAEEALEKMLPSKNLFSPTHGGLMLTPGQDGVLGIYQATKWGKKKPGKFTEAQALSLLKNGKLKSSDVISVEGRPKLTTPGRLLINSTLPKGAKNDEELLYDPKFIMAKGEMKGFASRIARSDPDEFSAMIDGWKELGFNLAYKNGSSFSLNDFHDGRTIRDNVLKSYKAEEAAIRKSSKSRKKKDAEIVALYQKASKDLENVGTAHYKAKQTNRMWEWAESGAKGNWGQFGQLVMGPMIVQDPSKNFVPVPLTTSFGEGLPVSQYWASLHGARKGTLDRAAGTRDPGALTKELINTVIGYSVKEEDCGTSKGVLMSNAAKDVEGRFLAQEVPLKGGDKLTKGTLISSALHARIKSSGPSKVLVRSPLHCRKANGICATCYGLNERGKLYTKGTNVGVIAGHALGEPVTQMQMRTFHTGGAGADGLTDYFQQAKDLFKVPEKLRGAATLSEVTGAIEKIERDALGGKKVTIAGKLHIIPHTTPMLENLRVGSQVRKADPLSEGRKNPHDILRITNNMNAVRNHITTELDGLYVETTGNERRRNIETVIRAMTDVAQVTESSSNENLLNGQMASLSEIEERNRELKRLGQPLIKYKPVLKPMDKVPLSGKEDWMARLNFQRLKDTLIEGGAQNWKSDINGHPITGIAHGAAFGLEHPAIPKASQIPATTSPTMRPPNAVKSPTPTQKPNAPTNTGFFGSFFRS